VGLLKELQDLSFATLGNLRGFRHKERVSDLPLEDVLLLTRDIDAPRITIEPLFRRFMSHWTDGPTLDGTYYALETLLIIAGSDSLGQEEKAAIANFVDRFHAEAEGGYSIVPGRSGGNLYATHLAIGIAKSLEGRACEERLSNYSHWLPSSCREGILRFVRERYDGETGAFTDSDEWGKPGLMANAHAEAIAWNLGFSADDFLSICSKDGLTAFIRQCLRTGKVGDCRWTAFAPTRYTQQPGLSVTYNALRLIRNLSLEVEIPYAEVSNYLDLCWTGEAFAGTAGDSPSVLGCSYALRLKKLSDGEIAFPEERQRAILSFVEKCKVGDLFAFVPGLTPNCFATRCATQIRLILSAESDDMTEGREAVKQKAIWDSLYWPEKGAFSIYPKVLLERLHFRSFGGILLDALVDTIEGPRIVFDALLSGFLTEGRKRSSTKGKAWDR